MIFTNLLTGLSVVIIISLVLIIIGSFLSSKRKQLYALTVILIAIILLMTGCLLYMFATDKLSEASVGSLQGQGVLSFTINNELVPVQSYWGLSTGFLIMIGAILFLGVAFVLELLPVLRKRNRQHRKT